MAYESTYTGAQVDAAVGRVTDNKFLDIEASSLNVTFGAPMTVATGESKYLTKNFVLESNTYYIVEINAVVSPTGTPTSPPNAFLTEGDDIGDGVGMLLGTAIGDSVEGGRTSLSVPGGLALSQAYGAGDEEDERAIFYRGYVRTGASPECRFYYRADDSGVQLSFSQFDATFTKVRASDVQAIDVSAPLS